MGAGASAVGTSAVGTIRTVRDAVNFIGTGASPVMVSRRLLRSGSFVAIDVDETCRKDAREIYPLDVTLHVGVVKGQPCAAPGHNALEYTIQVDEGHTICVRRKFLSPLHLPELHEQDIWVSPKCRDVAVQVEWQGGAKFAAEVVKREKGVYDVRFKGGKREVLTGVPLSKLLPIDHETRHHDSPETLAPDPLWLLDRKIQADIDVKWPIARRLTEALELLRSQMRPPGAPPVRGPFVGTRTFDSEGYPAHPSPLDELKVDGAFVDTWGKFAGKIKFATTFKIGPSYPRMDAWVDRVDAGDPLYFHAALPVYAGLISLGMFKLPGESGVGQPEWVRASDVALVGIAIYVNGELCPGPFQDPPLEKAGIQKYGHESCHYIPGCAATYMTDATWIGASFCLAPTENDYELLDDIYGITIYHQLLREWSRRPRVAGEPRNQPREIDVQINLVLSTSYLANLRQVCAGSVRVVLSDQGLAMAYERMQHIQEKRLNSQEAKFPKRPRKALSEWSIEEGLEKKPLNHFDFFRPGGKGAAKALAIVEHCPDAALEDVDSNDVVPPPDRSPPSSPVTRRSKLEQQLGVVPPPPPRAKGNTAHPPSMPAAGVSTFMVSGMPTPQTTFYGGGGGSAANPIRGPDFELRHLAESAGHSSTSPLGGGGFGGRKPQPPPRRTGQESVSRIFIGPGAK